MFTNEKELVFGVVVAALTLLIFAVLIVLLVYNYFRVRMQRDREILHAVFDTQEKERSRIAEDLHDDIGVKLAALKLRNELIIHDSEAVTVRDAALLNGSMLDDIVNTLRRIVRNQASTYITSNGLSYELNSLCNQYRGVTSAEILLDVPDDPITENQLLMVAFFRIVQELLHNAVKHSGAQHISIVIERSQKRIVLVFSDDGHGFPDASKGEEGMGLKNIRARAELHQGEVLLKSTPGKGTSYTFTFNSA